MAMSNTNMGIARPTILARWDPPKPQIAITGRKCLPSERQPRQLAPALLSRPHWPEVPVRRAEQLQCPPEAEALSAVEVVGAELAPPIPPAAMSALVVVPSAEVGAMSLAEGIECEVLGSVG